MEIDKTKLKEEYLSGNYDAFFKEAEEITEFLISKHFYGLKEDPDEYADVVQDCMVSLWEKHIANKINTSKGDLMAFVWKNSSFKILDYIKKKKRRNNIIYFFSYEEAISDNEYYQKHKEMIESEGY